MEKNADQSVGNCVLHTKTVIAHAILFATELIAEIVGVSAKITISEDSIA